MLQSSDRAAVRFAQGSRSCPVLAEARRGIAYIRQIGGTRAGAEMAKQFVVTGTAFKPADRGIFLLKIAERDRIRGAGVLARRLDFIDPDGAVLALGEAASSADALDAIGALLHDAARAHRYLGVLLPAIGFKAEVGVFLTVGVSEEIEATHFVWTVRFAEPGADASVVNLQIEPFAIVHGGRNRTDRLAWRVLAVHARHRLKSKFRTGGRAVVVDVHPQPMHVASARHFLRTDDRHVVFRLTGDHASVAANAYRSIDDHGPGMGSLRPWSLRHQARLPFRIVLRLVCLGKFADRIQLADVFEPPNDILRGED